MARVRSIPIIALDVPDAARAFAMVERLGDECRFYKVGMQLFTAEGPRVVERLREQGARVFLDLKFHDIPNTVRGGVRSAAAMGASLVTVHASGGRAMLEAAREGAGDSGLEVLAVTVLTSMDATALGGAWGRDDVSVQQEVLRLAALAAEAGVAGVVCSGHEAAAVTSAYAQLGVLVPGVRPAGEASQDQARVVTPEGAQAAGARWIVLGRAVTGAADPKAALLAITESLGRD